ncbi:suppressor of fused domain protein [Nocardia sp. GCM10030253]|uniref:suppressor of fused domain protein n=1 Tax=Nocardia sp. GCM10030253 TaxID=3273404 RepID=UPI00362EFBE4
MKASDDNRQIAETARAVFGGTPRVVQYLDADEKSEIAVLSSVDRPEPGLISFCTITLSDHPIPGRVQPPLGVEIVAVSTAPEFAAVLSTAAFCAINSGWLVEPGRVFPDVVGAHISDTTVPHLMFVDPFLWDDSDFAARPMTGKTVAWVQGVPISDAEMEYVRSHSSDALEDLFVSAQPDVLDLRRPSVV